MQNSWKQGEPVRQPSPRLDLQLIGREYAAYQTAPELYLIERIRVSNPWPEVSEENMLTFLQ
jgi:hypothetical protein